MKVSIGGSAGRNPATTRQWGLIVNVDDPAWLTIQDDDGNVEWSRRTRVTAVRLTLPYVFCELRVTATWWRKAE